MTDELRKTQLVTL